jgi:uncharacterized membrane protein
VTMAVMSDAPGPAEAHTGLSKHRLEALTDGVFAVAMTLLVIELKLPEDVAAHGPSELARGLVRLIPTFIAWIISFFVLAIFWFSHHRLFHFVRTVDGKLLSLNIVYLGFVSLMPFSSALTGKYAPMPLSQWLYSTNMALLALLGLLNWRYVFRHPELWGTPLSVGLYRGARFRALGLMVVALAAVGIAMIIPGAGNMAFMLMWPISVGSRRVEGPDPRRIDGV